MTVQFSSWNSPTRTKGKIACCKLSIVCSPFYFWILRREKSYKWLYIITLTSTAFWKVTKEEGGGGSNLVPSTNFKDIPASRIGKKNLKYFFLCIRFQGNLDSGFHGSHIFYGANIASRRFIN